MASYHVENTGTYGQELQGHHGDSALFNHQSQTADYSQESYATN